MLADTIGAQLSSMLGSVIDTIMTGIWVAAVGMLRGAFQLVDTFTTVDFVGVDTVTVGIDGAVRPLSPLGAVWPVLRWLSLAIAVGLFFVQLAATMLRGGRGLFRLVTGPFAYAVAVAMTAGGITLLFAAADGMTTVLLQQGLRADGFVGVLDSDAAQAVFSPAPTLDPVDPGRAGPRRRGHQPVRRDRPLGHPRRGGVGRGHPGLVRVRAGVGVPARGVPRAGRDLADQRRRAAVRRHRRAGTGAGCGGPRRPR